MAKRIQVDPSLGGSPSLQPVATPTSTYYTPRLPAPVLQAVTDLSGLSDSLARVHQKTLEQTAEKDYAFAKGEAQSSAAVLEELASAGRGLTDAKAARDALQKKYAELARAGKISRADAPFTSVAWMESAAEHVMNAYRTELTTQLAQAASLVDPTTGLPKLPGTAEEVIQKTWAKYGDQGVLKTYYGSKVVGSLKGNIDLRFQEDLASAQGANKVAALDNAAREQITNFTKDQYLSGGGLSAEDLQLIGAKASEVFNRGMEPDKFERLLLDSFSDAALAVYAKDGPGAAAAALDQLRDTQIGPRKLGTFPTVARMIDAKFAEYTRQVEDDRGRDTERLSREAHQTTILATADLTQYMQDHPGALPEDWQRTVATGAYGIRTTAYASMQAVAQFRELQRSVRADQETVNSIDTLLNRGDHEGALALLYASGDSLDHKTWTDLHKSALALQDGSGTLAKNPAVVQFNERVDAAVKLAPINRDAPGGGKLYNDLMAPAYALQTEMAAWVVDHPRAPRAEFDTVFVPKMAAAEEAQRRVVAEFTKTVQENTDLFERQLAFHADTSTALQALRPLLSAGEYDRMAQRAAASANIAAVAGARLPDILREEERLFLAAKRAEGEQGLSAVQVGRLQAVQGHINAWLPGWISAAAKDATIAPAQADAALEAAMRAEVKTFLEASTEQLRVEPKKGETVEAEELRKQQIAQEQEKVRGFDELVKRGGRSAAADGYVADLAADPDFPQDLVAGGKNSPLRKFLADPNRVQAAAVYEDSLGIATAAVLGNQSLAPDVRAKQAARARYEVGVTLEEALTGKLVVPYSGPSSRAASAKQLADMRLVTIQSRSQRFAGLFEQQVLADGRYDPTSPVYADLTWRERGGNMSSPSRAGSVDRSGAGRAYLQAYAHHLLISEGPGNEVDASSVDLPTTAHISDVQDAFAFVREQPEKAKALAKRMGLSDTEDGLRNLADILTKNRRRVSGQ